MRTRFAIAALLFMMIQAVLFGVGVLVVLATPLEARAMEFMPIVIVATALLSASISWWLAPRLRARYWREKRELGVTDKALDALS